MREDSRVSLSALPVPARRRSAKLRRHPLLETALTYFDRKFDFEAFAAAMVADLNPQGPIETTLAARVVSLAWRLNRAQSLEASFLSRSKYSGEHSTPIDEALSKGRDVQLLDGIQRWETSLQRNLIGVLDHLRVLQASRKVTALGSNDRDAPSADGEEPKDVS